MSLGVPSVLRNDGKCNRGKKCKNSNENPYAGVLSAEVGDCTNEEKPKFWTFYEISERN